MPSCCHIGFHVLATGHDHACGSGARHLFFVSRRDKARQMLLIVTLQSVEGISSCNSNHSILQSEASLGCPRRFQTKQCSSMSASLGVLCGPRIAAAIVHEQPWSDSMWKCFVFHANVLWYFLFKMCKFFKLFLFWQVFRVQLLLLSMHRAYPKSSIRTPNCAI